MTFDPSNGLHFGLAKNSILANMSLKSGKLGKIGNYDVIHRMFVLFFGIYGKSSSMAIPWYQTNIPQALVFKFRGGLQQLPLVGHVTKNSLIRRGLSCDAYLVLFPLCK